MPPIPIDQVSPYGREQRRRTAALDRPEQRRGEGEPMGPRGPPIEPRLLPIAGVKARYGWSRSQTYRLLGEGRLRACKLGRKLLIFTDSCEEVVTTLPVAQIKAPPGVKGAVGEPVKKSAAEVHRQQIVDQETATTS